MLKKAEKGPVVFAIVDVGNSSFVGVTISSYLTGVDSDMVAGFDGSRECALIVAPPGLDRTLSICMVKVLGETLTSAGFRDAAAKAKRSLDIANGRKSREDLRVDTGAVVKFSPLFRNAIKGVRK